MSDVVKHKPSILLILVFPYILPSIDINQGTIFIFLTSLFIMFFFVAKGQVNISVLNSLVIFSSISLLLFVLLYQVVNGIYHLYPLNYILRYICFCFLFIFYSKYIRTNYHHRDDAICDFAITLFWVILIGSIFELILKNVNLNNILYFYKARQDLGGIDTLHYNRLSGFSSYPGDLAALSVICFICIDKYCRSYWKLIVLFVVLLMTQSKAGIITLLSFYIISILFKITIKDILLLLLFFLISSFLIFYFNLEYFIKFIDNIDFYLSASKRAQEIIRFFTADYTQMLFGVHNLFPTYESEWFSTLNRNGLIGSFWLIIPTIALIFKFCTNENSRSLIIILISFVFVYCVISAGFSRAKISIFSIYLFSLVFCDFKKVK